MELAGIAAGIADARARAAAAASDCCAASSTARQQRSSCAVSASSPLDLFGYVGEGTPADAMAQEALLLWVGIMDAPPGLWAPRGGRAGEPKGTTGEGGGVSSDVVRRLRKEGLDAPVLKSIFCASDAIRLQLAQSLLAVCGVTEETLMTADQASADGDATDRDSTRIDSAGSDTADGDRRASKVDDEGVEDGDGVSVVHEDVEFKTDRLFQGSDNKENTEERRPQGSTSPEDERAPPANTKPAMKEADGRDRREQEALVADLRGHIVRLLLDNIPRPEAAEGSSRETDSKQEATVPGIGAGKGPGTGPRIDAPRKDCTQLFDVLCALVRKSLIVDGARNQRSSEPPLDLSSLSSDLVERLVAHPCREKRGSKEVDKDTLLVRNIVGD